MYSEGFGVLFLGQYFVNVFVIQMRQSFSYVLRSVHHYHAGSLVCMYIHACKLWLIEMYIHACELGLIDMYIHACELGLIEMLSDRFARILGLFFYFSSGCLLFVLVAFRLCGRLQLLFDVEAGRGRYLFWFWSGCLCV